LIRQVKAITQVPVAVITNGSLLYLPEVRQELAASDAVLPTLDAGTEALYRQINRPHAEITFARLVEGLVAFRNEYQDKLWVEVMLVQGVNDGPEALGDIAEVLKRVLPDAVHINLPTRAPAETWVQPPRMKA
jgi:wyosine [tRNA(Phe)-imidazoG37] synthetase (radical SAM superfamily)